MRIVLARVLQRCKFTRLPGEPKPEFRGIAVTPSDDLGLRLDRIATGTRSAPTEGQLDSRLVYVTDGPHNAAVNTTCDLCGCAAKAGSRNFGLDFCEVCATGQLQGRLHAWGGLCKIEEFVRGDDPDPFVRVVATVTGAQPLFAFFHGRSLLLTLVRLFSPTLKSGDPIFDRAVIASGPRTTPVLQALLADEGFQSAILALVAHCDVVEINGSQLEIEAQLTDFDLRAEIPSAAVAVLRHLARLG